MPTLGKPSQDFVPIRDIRNGVIVLNNGDLRMMLMTSSLNFGLKSGDEQAAILMQFQNVLNSLEFPIQISIQSKRLDIRPYLKMLEERERAQLVDAMKIQVHEYISFVRDFTSRTNIMSKNFFIIIPYSGGVSLAKGSGGGGLLSGIFGKKASSKKLTAAETHSFEEARVQLEQRASIVEQGLSRCDLRTIRLGTEEITELFYKKFNPGELESSVM
ncbi:MAG: hypothetical protein A2845_00130 [Candidatus Lloydbacteria bacterium RIFCSPHIGHO2_01_FULL_49_22]|uniref:Uncharacterized protein n=1 Tax=Candidatus Lloydbacteria bacterium RIFCSPHIGHO2_01_FULL_49_22 TaxID=1798658 RepID=A0A1G2CXX1_9BACT|nr:MAG: hypothetical protein A2845_00130 [Candidatus Lloydbacteria bacterium RIFCSPHIGHO2_01_FULL_49_22]OGZ09275.1 MAG: hypothetical protein A3C14_05035 [Candidatus Lloydbacteria bacterium RIFCSPHIGHO2_02_FULL_50_18]